MTEKTGDLSLSAFTNRVKETLSLEWADAVKAKVTEDELNIILENNYNDYKDVALTRTIGRVKKQIKNKIKIANSTRVKGCIVGSRDRAGKNSPIRYMLLKPDKKHLEVSNFGKKTIFKADEEYEIPVPSLATIMVDYDPEYRTYNLQGIDEFKREHVDQEQLLGILSAAHISGKEITKDMSWSKEKSATPIVIFGEITSVKPEVTGFVENEDGSKRVAGYHPVWIKSEEGDYQPCFNFGLKVGGGGKFVRCHIEHQRYGEPTVMFDDLNNICKRAVSKFPDDPMKQADNLREWLDEVKVFVAGVITQYREAFDASGKPVTNIEIGVAAVVEIKKDVADNDKLQEVLPSDVTNAEKKSEKTEKKKAEEKSTQSENMPTMIKQAVEDLTLFCEAADIDPSTLTVETIKKKALSRLDGVPDGVILEAIDIIKAGKK
jgi:hypothetical protein